MFLKALESSHFGLLLTMATLQRDMLLQVWTIFCQFGTCLMDHKIQTVKNRAGAFQNNIAWPKVIEVEPILVEVFSGQQRQEAR